MGADLILSCVPCCDMDDKRIQQARLLITQPWVSKVISSHPHPSEWGKDNGLTQLDYIHWIFENAGHSGQLKAAIMVGRSIAHEKGKQ